MSIAITAKQGRAILKKAAESHRMRLASQTRRNTESALGACVLFRTGGRVPTCEVMDREHCLEADAIAQGEDPGSFTKFFPGKNCSNVKAS